MAKAQEFTPIRSEHHTGAVYKNRKTKTQIPYIKKADMEKAFPAGGYIVRGQIGKGKQIFGVLHTQAGDEPVYRTQKMSMTAVQGFVQIGENDFLAVVKSTVPLFILLFVLIAALCVGSAFLIRHFLPNHSGTPENTTQPPLIIDAGAEEGEGQISVPESINVKQKNIKVNGPATIHLKANQLEQNFVFSNPKENPCFFEIQLVLADTGEVIYTSNFIPPGYSVSKFKLNRPMEAGTYKVIAVYNTYSFDQARVPLNNFKANTTLVVE